MCPLLKFRVTKDENCTFLNNLLEDRLSAAILVRPTGKKIKVHERKKEKTIDTDRGRQPSLCNVARV